MKAWAIYSRLVLTTVCWAAVFHVAKFTVAAASPAAVVAWRFMLAAAILVPVVWYRERLPWQALRRNALPLLAMSAIGIFGFNIATFYGLRSTSATNAAMIMALNPAMTAVLAALVGRERVSRHQIAGLVLGIAGVMVVVSHGSWQAIATLSFSGGDLLMLLASFCWACYPVIPKRFISGMSPMQITASTIAGGAFLMALFALRAAPDFMDAPSGPVVAGIAFMGVFGTVLAYIWWNQGVKALGAPAVAGFINLVPMLTAGFGLMLGQPVSWAQACGAILVVTGVLYPSLAPALRLRWAAPAKSWSRG
ncbi:Permease of the drug/metabolite transporter (DMT) superfamily [Noviherbaspirillum humi]|uniref:Permease of the drug/metabolite transporter (DMT) superfamily n=1 Tax=Noviherbaspirillum humi TaxID=1688639 RepID=A0A239JRS6_9BURK|nr:DMT family transporter [Noviherbaspirillum humi]SNT08540.1 Permease of the drug/metabolite transporter (DMT) superfamily [Noviherbaspirillum humi]